MLPLTKVNIKVNILCILISFLRQIKSKVKVHFSAIIASIYSFTNCISHTSYLCLLRPESPQSCIDFIDLLPQPRYHYNLCYHTSYLRFFRADSPQSCIDFIDLSCQPWYHSLADPLDNTKYYYTSYNWNDKWRYMIGLKKSRGSETNIHVSLLT